MASRPVEEPSLTSKTRPIDLPSPMRTSRRFSISSQAGSLAVTARPTSISPPILDSSLQRTQASTSSAWPGRKTMEKPKSTMIKTELLIITSITDQPRPSSTNATADPPSTSYSSLVIEPPQSAEPTPASQVNQQPGHTEEHPPLSNGATAGIVLAVVAVLLGVFFLVRYIYKHRGFCYRRRSFSPIQEPYHHPPSGPTTRSFFPMQRPCSWLSEPCEQSCPSLVTTPALEAFVELQTFTKPQFGPRMYDVGCSGNALLMPAQDGHHYYQNHPIPDTQSQMAEPASPRQTDENVSVSHRRQTPSIRRHHGAVHSRRRTGQIPWEENYRC